MNYDRYTVIFSSESSFMQSLSTNFNTQWTSSWIHNEESWKNYIGKVRCTSWVYWSNQIDINIFKQLSISKNMKTHCSTDNQLVLDSVRFPSMILFHHLKNTARPDGYIYSDSWSTDCSRRGRYTDQRVSIFSRDSMTSSFAARQNPMIEVSAGRSAIEDLDKASDYYGCNPFRVSYDFGPRETSGFVSNFSTKIAVLWPSVGRWGRWSGHSRFASRQSTYNEIA